MPLTIIIPNRYPDIIAPLIESMNRLDPIHRTIIIANGHSNSYGFEMIPYDWPKFCYSHAINLGLRASSGNVILLNDDIRLLEEDTFQRLDKIGMSRSEIGVLSPLIKGCAGNPIQRWHERHICWGEFEKLKYQHGMPPVCFPCVWVRRETIEAVGELDETITTYGGDDVEYCIRIRKTGYRTAVTSSIVVQHGDGSRALGEGRGSSWSLSYARQNLR